MDSVKKKEVEDAFEIALREQVDAFVTADVEHVSTILTDFFDALEPATSFDKSESQSIVGFVLQVTKLSVELFEEAAKSVKYRGSWFFPLSSFRGNRQLREKLDLLWQDASEKCTSDKKSQTVTMLCRTSLQIDSDVAQKIDTEISKLRQSLGEKKRSACDALVRETLEYLPSYTSKRRDFWKQGMKSVLGISLIFFACDVLLGGGKTSKKLSSDLYQQMSNTSFAKFLKENSVIRVSLITEDRVMEEVSKHVKRLESKLDSSLTSKLPDAVSDALSKAVSVHMMHDVCQEVRIEMQTAVAKKSWTRILKDMIALILGLVAAILDWNIPTVGRAFNWLRTKSRGIFDVEIPFVGQLPQNIKGKIDSVLDSLDGEEAPSKFLRFLLTTFGIALFIQLLLLILYFFWWPNHDKTKTTRA
jgi:hypothetical protein